ncbi:hypothetical protein DOROTHY_81 [Mycobacterium phage Dorothy]|uniref:Uncharacterized protein n=3 Tax=Cheoctovirus TaxID=1623281 RepID=A0A076YHG3_9CAUD|nr:gp83 [Mycobacterium phage Ramsey]YP_009125359.1 hypothetical protein VC69_gp078 [Mycobacterium phage Inventum]YP_009592056.1 hypothetical protein FDG65_gp081 [Mycobacterium phage Dorothy]QWY82572.1 hypothetical protein SEA_SASSAFRAS_81 [Mycobacterium phage Sassafras]WAB10360.1 hypothetical protein PBI_REDBIRD_81 [Mycobacterium phage RedBird]ACI12695.1 hypothetical protein RAMSEY_83 [Mycobacterium phage Ramsey]AFQ97471.1 hypothetical protein DOROTHY_81 [Mycobacterium phage Dorothy]AIK67693
MNNPELRAVLTEALSEALKRLWTDPEDAADQADWDALPGKLADVIASLPGVAVIQLPDEAEIRARHISFGRGADCECCPPWIKDEDIDIEYSVSEAREFAAALLAAAAVVAAGEEA